MNLFLNVFESILSSLLAHFFFVLLFPPAPSREWIGFPLTTVGSLSLKKRSPTSTLFFPSVDEESVHTTWNVSSTNLKSQLSVACLKRKSPSLVDWKIKDGVKFWTIFQRDETRRQELLEQQQTSFSTLESEWFAVDTAHPAGRWLVWMHHWIDLPNDDLWHLWSARPHRDLDVVFVCFLMTDALMKPKKALSENDSVLWAGVSGQTTKVTWSHCRPQACFKVETLAVALKRFTVTYRGQKYFTLSFA